MTSDELSERAQDLEDFLRICIEFGLFSDESGLSDAIIQKIEEARTKTADGALAAAATTLSQGERDLHAALERRSSLWRAVHLYQLPVGFYYLVTFAVLLSLGLAIDESASVRLLGVPVGVAVAGALGAVLRGIWWLYRQVARRLYRPHFVLAHLLAPFIGALFGLLAFLLLQAGVLSLGASDDAKLDEAALPRAVAFFAGFSWEWMVGKLDQLRAD